MPILPLTDEEYAEWLKNSQETPLWQSLEWKSSQESLGRETRLYGLQNDSGALEAAALVIIDHTMFGLSTWDIPRGPTGNPEYFAELILGIVAEAKQGRCMALYTSPTSKPPHFSTSPSDSVIRAGQPSSRHEQPEATIIVDLTQSDDDLLRHMHEKGRYNIRLAQRHGMSVEQSQDIDAFYRLLERTGVRDHYGIKPKSHYRTFLEALPGSFLLLAFDHSDTQKKSLAGLMGVIFEKTGVYYYGASDHAGRAKMAPSLLQFEAMKFCRARGASRYDLFGIAPSDDPRHPWAGVTRFKKQFGGLVLIYPPEREITLMPVTKMLIAWKRKAIG